MTPSDDTCHLQADAPDDAEDRRLALLLDQYLEGLHCGRVSECRRLLAENPELSAMVRCLDALDSLAPEPLFNPVSAPADAPTLLADGESSPRRAPAHAHLPRDFGKYELMEELGRGGMGVVYLARQRDLERLVAIKMILSSHLATDEEVRRFYAEAKAAGGLRHPNIVGIHEVGQIEGQHYFAMDYVAGSSLAELIRRGGIDADRTARFVSEMARAVQSLHDHHLIHRDLKPSNILIDENGRCYVTDFGLAKIFAGDSERTRTGTIVGTPSYMAPEQAAGRTSDVSPRSDVYSLGAILYELLTGRPPYQRDNPLDTLVDVLEGEPTLPTKLNRTVPRGLERICLRCLEKDPQRRYATASELADDLDRYSRSEPVLAQSADFLQKLRRWGRREPALVSRLGTLIAAATLLQVNFLIAGVDRTFHIMVMSVLAAWGVLSYFFQLMLHRERTADVARFAWSAADAVLLTLLIYIADPPRGPLLIGYPMLVAASGLFFQVRLVVFTTCVCLTSYAALMFLTPEEANPRHYPFIFGLVLAVLGAIVAYQVYRVRALSRHFDSRR